jgi:GNAT superfamily N-acetyltransferase
MTDISATGFFRQAAADGIGFDHEETDTGSSIWPTRVKLKALHPETGEEMGFLDYQVPRIKSKKITVHELKTHEDYQRQGVGSALMDEMQRRHPGTPIDHGDRTPEGKAWWKGYTDGKRVQRGRTMASLAGLPDGMICIYPHYTGLTSTAGEYPDPDKEHDRSQESWTQRRQYAAESRAQHLLPEHKIASPEDAQALADKVTQASRVRPVTVSHDPSYNYSFHQEHPHHSGHSRIVLGNGGMNQLTLLHELAHHVDREMGTYSREEGHGESFHDHLNGLLRVHHPQGQMAEWALRDRFHETDAAMREGEHAYLFSDIPNPKMTDRERARRPPEKPKPLWGDEKHDPETLDLATEAHVVGNHYLKHGPYPRLDPSKGPIGDQVTARGADKNLSQGVALRLLKPSHVKNWVDHHPDLEGIRQRFLKDTGYDDHDQMRRELYNKFPDNAPKDHSPWTGADPHKVMTREHEAGNHYANYPGHDIDDLDYDAPEEHWRPHWEAMGTDGLLKDGFVKPHQVSHEDAAQWLRYHPDRAGIEQRHGVKTASVRRTAATKPCPCCGGLGEHGTGFECYHCDAGMTVPADSPDTAFCDGQLPDGGHGKTAAADGPAPKSYRWTQTYMGPEGYEDRENEIQGPLYHGGGPRWREGQPIKPGRKPNAWGDEYGKSQHVYFTTNRDTAADYARRSGGHVFEVEPTGDFRMDHHEGEFKTKHPLNVTRRLAPSEWDGSKTAAADGPHSKVSMATNWDEHYPEISAVHRGMGVSLPRDLHDLVHDDTKPWETRAQALWGHLQKHPLGMHWTADPDMGKSFAAQNARKEHLDEPDTHSTPVVIHAHVPAREDIETDRNVLRKRRVKDFDQDYYGNYEQEVPIKPGASVHISGISWADPSSYREGRGYRFKRHYFDEGLQHTASADTPVPDNSQPYEHAHDWLPRDHFFAPGEKGLDPRLFDGEHMRPEVRQYLLSLLNSFWAPRYGDSWQSWARVYLAGSEASHFYGNGDLDILIGINYDLAHQHVDAFTGEPDIALGDKLTEELHAHLNDDLRMLPGPDGETGPWENTWFILRDPSGTGDIRHIHPYAAYDITADDWAVKPVEVPDDFGPEKLPEVNWDIVDSVRGLVKAIGELPAGTREREGAALYDYLHSDRSAAFGDEGSGLYDAANVTWKALSAAPDSPLQQLVDWKHAHGTAATDREIAA